MFRQATNKNTNKVGGPGHNPEAVQKVGVHRAVPRGLLEHPLPKAIGRGDRRTKWPAARSPRVGRFSMHPTLETRRSEQR